MTETNTPHVLVTGGAGYIGSHTTLALLEAGHAVVVLDDLSTGDKALVPDGVPFVEGDVADAGLVEGVISEYGCRGVLHFAGSIVVPESVRDPLKYYRNNTAASRSLIESCVAAGVETFVFSSTAAVYGDAVEVPIREETALQPTNPYGWSKLMTEQMLRDVAAATDLRYAALRYFNVAGADAAGRSGECAPLATHLIHVASELVAGKRDRMQIFGDDYDTPDGTCVRDYIHVSDLAAAHVAALRHLTEHRQSLELNCGYGHGFSVREVLDVVRDLAGRDLAIESGPRRAGDVAALIADTHKIRATLDWTPRFDDLRVIVETALNWERRRSGGH